MALHAGRQAGFLDATILPQNGAAPGQVHLGGRDAPAAHHHARVGSVVADGVVHLAHDLGVAVELLDARVDDLDGRRNVFGGGQHLLDGDAWALQRRFEHEGQLHFDPGRDEAGGRDVQLLAGLAGEQHAVEQGAVVRLVDLAADLHGARGQAYLVADDAAALGALHGHPGAADAIAVLDRHAGIAAREVFDLNAALFRFVKLSGQRPDQCVVEH